MSHTLVATNFIYLYCLNMLLTVHCLVHLLNITKYLLKISKQTNKPILGMMVHAFHLSIQEVDTSRSVLG